MTETHIKKRNSSSIEYQPESIAFKFKIVRSNKKSCSIDDIHTPFYPTDLTLCYFAKVPYEDEIGSLPDGWTLACTGKNKKNGYFGVAFWREEHQQLVISHRGGTASLKNLGRVFQENVNQQSTSQIHSACTFTFIALRTVNSDRCSISITGHSGGGWLAQITGFAVQYLKVHERTFLKLERKERKYHPHIVTFDAPSTYKFLCQLCENYFQRYTSDDVISFLDISNYFIERNIIDIKDRHVGRLHYFEKNATESLHDQHEIHSFLKAFRSSNKIITVNALDWPASRTYSLRCDSDSDADYFEKGNHCFNIERSITDINSFKEAELIFLELWKRFQNEETGSSEIIAFFEKNKLGNLQKFLADFEITDEIIHCDGYRQLDIIINRTKKIFQLFPELSKIIENQNLFMPRIYEKMFKNATDRYIKALPSGEVNFDILNVEQFLESKEQGVMILVPVEPTEEASIIYKILEKLQKKFYFFKWTDLEFMEFYMDTIKILNTTSELDVFVIDFDNQAIDVIIEFSQKWPENTEKKLICLTNQKIKLSEELPDRIYVKIAKNMTFKDLPKNSQSYVLNKKIISSKSKHVSLESLLIERNFFQTLQFDILKKCFLTNQNKMIDFEVKKNRFSLSCQDFYISRRFTVLEMQTITSSNEKISNSNIVCADLSENDLIENTKVVVISDEPGTGKSSTMLALANKIQKSWIIWINLVEACKHVGILSTVDLDSATAFLLKFAEESSELSILLLKFCLSKEKSFPVNLFFDGFDEIQSFANEKGSVLVPRGDVLKRILQLLLYLKDKTHAKIWISTRPSECSALEKILTVNNWSIGKSYLAVIFIKFQELEKEEQEQLLRKFWQSGTRGNKYIPDKMTVANVLNRLNSDKSKEFSSLVGIPLQLRMTSELLHPENDDFNLHTLYSDWINLKFESYLEKKSKDDIQPSFIHILQESLLEKHRILGMRHFFPDLFEYLRINVSENKMREINKIGLFQAKNEIVTFSHHTFADYFAAEMCFYLMENRADNEYIKQYIIKNLSSPNFNLIKRFFNDKLKTSEKSAKILKHFHNNKVGSSHATQSRSQSPRVNSVKTIFVNSFPPKKRWEKELRRMSSGVKKAKEIYEKYKTEYVSEKKIGRSVLLILALSCLLLALITHNGAGYKLSQKDSLL